MRGYFRVSKTEAPWNHPQLSPWLRIETNDDLGVPHFKKPHRSYYILIQVIIDDIFPMISHKSPIIYPIDSIPIIESCWRPSFTDTLRAAEMIRRKLGLRLKSLLTAWVLKSITPENWDLYFIIYTYMHDYDWLYNDIYIYIYIYK